MITKAILITRYKEPKQQFPDFPIDWNAKKVWDMFLLQAYRLFIKAPFFSSYMRVLRKRILIKYRIEEIALRKATILMTGVILCTLAMILITLVFFHHKISTIFLMVLCCIILHSVAIDIVIYRTEKKLLLDITSSFIAVRHSYHKHGMIEEAIYEASNHIAGLCSDHMSFIYQAILSPNAKDELECYYKVAPNRFLTAFAGISYMVMEFGDLPKNQPSVYLKALTNLTQEINLEVLKRDKLDYLLNGLNIIAVAPILFTQPIEYWARCTFPAMNEFYESKLGLMTKLCIYTIVIFCYVFLQKLKQEKSTDFRPGKAKVNLDVYLSRITWLKRLATFMSPVRGSEDYIKALRLIKESNSQLKYEWLIIRRWCLSILCFIVVGVSAITFHIVERKHIVDDVFQEERFFGKMGKEEQKKAEEKRMLDKKVMKELNMSASCTYEQVRSAIKKRWGIALSDQHIDTHINRVRNKLKNYNNEYLKWWEFLLCVVGGLIGHHIPMWLLYFQRKMRVMDMKQELYHFHFIISILKDMDRICVEQLLEWMDKLSIVFKTALQKCLLHYNHGAEYALEVLRQETSLPEMHRLIDKLELCLDKVPIGRAFDDLDTQMMFYFEERKNEYIKMLDSKAGWGKTLGFLPMYVVIFLYLVVPFVWLSFLQFQQYYEQIQKL